MNTLFGNTVSAKQELSGLDMMRAIAAMCVVLVHSSGLLFERVLVPGAYLAVDFFFALSGYVIAHAYDRKTMSMSDFMLKRVARLYPLYALGLLLGALQAVALVAMHRSAMSWTDVAASLALHALYLPSPFSGGGDALFPLNGPFWSLFFELVVNIVYASFIYRSRWAMGVVAGIALIVLVQASWSEGHADLGWQWPWMHVGLAKVLTSFTLGACVRRYLPACPWALRGWSVGALFLVLYGAFALPVPEGPWRAILDLTFILLISPTLIWFGASIAATPGQEAWFKTLGGASYGMYVIHLPLMFAAGFVGHKVGVHPLLLGLSFVVAVQALAIWLERCYDRPARVRLYAWL
jgi:peptidoglycan/LPS O-acetylase OafA/YrhL